jgi:hypothetical protein
VAIRKLCILRKNYEYLVNELRVSTYLDAFFSERVMSFEDKENLQKERGKVEQARKFLGLLLHTAEENIKKFFEILKTRQDKQPHIYRHLFSRADDQTAGNEATGDGLRQPIARRDDKTVSSSLTTSNAEWETLVIPHFPALLDALRPCLLLHHLRAAHLLTSAEFDQLQDESLTEQGRSQRLLNTILPCKERAVEKFCQVLLAVEGQKHIVSKILKLNEATQQVGVEQVSGSLPGHVPVTTSSSEVQMEASMATNTGDRNQQVSSNLHRNETVSMEREKRTCEGDAAVHHVTNQGMPSAMFVFRHTHLSWIQRVKSFVCNTCYQCFGIAEESVSLTSAEAAEFNELVERCSDHPVYVDSNSVLAALFIKGVEPENIRPVHIEQLESVILRYLQRYDPDLKKSDCKVLEIIFLNSSLMIFQLSIKLFVYLLCALNERFMLSSLKEAVRVIFPRTTRVDLRLGGLPPLELFNDEENAQTSEQQSSFPKLDDDSPRLPRFAYDTYQANKNIKAGSVLFWNSVESLKQQVTRCYKDTGSVDHRIKFTKNQLGLVRVNLKNVKEQQSKALHVYEAAKSSVVSSG